jgi:hypothetical protein
MISFPQDFGQLGACLIAHLRGRLSLPALEAAKVRSKTENEWFTRMQIDAALEAIATEWLQEERLASWLAHYPQLSDRSKERVAVVMAGNIPLVGFHDYLSVLASGRCIDIKLSSKDKYLLPTLHAMLCTMNPLWAARLRFCDTLPPAPQALIATGGDQTAAYFSRQFAGIPHIVRGSRVSVAVLPPCPTAVQLEGLYQDLFLYFGLGCRSVCCLFLPQGMHPSQVLLPQTSVEAATHIGFQNAYRRQKALLSLQGQDFIDGGFFVLQPSLEWHPPMATVYYRHYGSLEELAALLDKETLRLQSVVAEAGMLKNCVNFGLAQRPQLWDYADGIDTMML